MPEKVEPLSCGREVLMVVLGCGEKIESEDGQRIGLEGGAIFFVYWVLDKKKNSEFLFFFLRNDMFTTFLQQILSSRLLLVVIVNLKK